MAVAGQMQPPKIEGMIKYLDIIHWASRDYVGWLAYDQHFCLLSAHDPDLDWVIPQWELWNQLVTPSRVIGLIVAT